MKRLLWPLVGIVLWPLVGIDAQAAQLCCQTEPAAHWRSIDGRKCYTDRWRAKSELRWCRAPERPATKSPPHQPDPTLRAPAWILDWQREILWRTIEDLDREAPPAPLADPELTLRAFEEARGATRPPHVPRFDLGLPPPPAEPVPMPRPRPPWGDRVSPGAPFSPQPPPVPSGPLPTPPWTWLGLLLATLMLGTAATEDADL